MNSNPLLKHGFTPSFTGYSYQFFGAARLEIQQRELYRLQSAFKHHTMTDMRPALYHTQGKAMNSVLSQFGKNFENFIELPSLITLLDEMAGPNSPLRRFGSKIPALEKLRFLILAFSGAILAWSFAIRPTLEAIKELASSACLPLVGEGVMSFETDDYTTLPLGLQNVISLGKPGEIVLGDTVHIKATFRSEVTSVPDEAVIARAILNSDLAGTLGIFPTPKGIWDVGPLTFVIDWFIPIGRMIEDHQAYFRSPTLEFRVGHTAHIYIRMNDGREFDLFWRSSESSSLSDPPGDSWLQSSGVPWVSIPLCVSVLFSR
jgi:hypothetical protein